MTPIGNRTRDLPAFIAVPQPTAPLEMDFKKYLHKNNTGRWQFRLTYCRLFEFCDRNE